MTAELPLTRTDSIDVAAAPEALYALISDLPRTGEWSPVCVDVRWDDEGSPPVVGSMFTGYNRSGDRSWETRGQIVAAEPGREFGWIIGEGFVSWTYRIEPDGSGSRLTESWELTDRGQDRFRERYAERAGEVIAQRAAEAHAGIPASLKAIKAIAERA